MQKLTKKQKLFLECIKGNSDKILKKSWLTRGEIRTGNSLIDKRLVKSHHSQGYFYL